MKRRLPLWVIPALLAMSIVTIWLRLMIVRTTYSIDTTDRSIRVLLQQNEQAELRATELRSPRKLEVVARTRYGLSQPRADQVIRMQAGPAR